MWVPSGGVAVALAGFGVGGGFVAAAVEAGAAFGVLEEEVAFEDLAAAEGAGAAVFLGSNGHPGVHGLGPMRTGGAPA